MQIIWPSFKITNWLIFQILIFFSSSLNFQKAAAAAFVWTGENGVSSSNTGAPTTNNNNNNNHVSAPGPANSPVTTTCSSAGVGAVTVGGGGVQSQNPTQGLVHWMSAVMAEHMTSNSHHDPAVGMHYMWNGGVDVSSCFSA